MQVPVFCYHNAIRDGLERDLEFLRANGYRTLTASEIVDVLVGAVEPPDKPVGLTFDDGLLSLKTVGLPLFERYDARATIFAITGLTPEGTTEPGRPDDDFRLLGWNDLAALRDSGRFELGSHGHRHNPVHAETRSGPPLKVADYSRLYDVPVPFTEACDADTIRAADRTPTRPSTPLFEAERIIVGGEPEDAAPRVAADLSRSIASLRDRLGVERFHLCLPYGRGRDAMIGLAREARFESIFWSRREDRCANRPGDDPYRIVRVKHDFLRRLPGTGRRSLLDVFFAKVKRRITSDPWE